MKKLFDNVIFKIAFCSVGVFLIGFPITTAFVDNFFSDYLDLIWGVKWVASGVVLNTLLVITFGFLILKKMDK